MAMSLTDLQNYIAQYLPTNTRRAVTAATLREVLNQLTTEAFSSFRTYGLFEAGTMANALIALNAAVPTPQNGDLAFLKSAYEGPALYIGRSGVWTKAFADPTNGAIRNWNGMEASYYAAKIIQVQAGSFVSGTPYREWSVPSAVLVDVSAVGMNGLSADYAGGSPYITQGWYYVWACARSSDGDVKFLISQQYSLGPFAAEKNALPGGSSYDFIRMLPMAVYYNGAGATSPQPSNSFRPYYVEGAYPHPTPLWTYFDETTAAFKALTAGSATVATAVSLTPWVPETGRFAVLTIMAEWTGAAGSSGSAQVYTSIGAVQGFKIECGGSTSGHPVRARRDIRIAVNSAEEVHYICSSSSVQITIFARGFNIEEPS